MKTKTPLIIGFAILCCAQLYFPLKIVMEQRTVLSEGTEWKFECRPIDPNDPFRGKYITLAFTAEDFQTNDSTKYVRDELVYASLIEDSLGFAQIKQLSKTAPEGDDYIQVTVRYFTDISYNNNNAYTHEIDLRFPFRRFYMEESKAKPAETHVREAQRKDDVDVYALVNVKDGNSSLKNVFIDGTSIKEFVESYSE